MTNSDASALAQRALLILVTLSIAAGALTIRAFPIVLGAGVLALAVWTRPSLADIWRHHKKLIMALSALTALAAGSAAWSFDAGDTLERAAKLLLYFIPGIALLALVRRIGLNAADPLAVLPAAALIAGGLFILMEALCDMPVSRVLNNLSQENFPPSYYNRNYYNKELAFLVFASVPVLAGLAQARRFAWAAGVVAVLGFCLFLMANQTAQVAVPLMAVFYVLHRVTNGRIWWAIAPLALAGVLAAPWIAQFLFSALSAHMDSGWLREASAAMRLEIWDFVGRTALQNPVAGHGMEAARFMTFDTRALYYPGDTIMHPHNTALQLWLEFGALGASLAAVLLALLVRGVAHSPLRSTVTVGLLAAALIAWGMWQSWWIAAIFFVSALAQGYDAAAARSPSSERIQSAI